MISAGAARPPLGVSTALGATIACILFAAITLGLASCGRSDGPPEQADGWVAVWQLGDDEEKIHVVSVRCADGEVRAEYAAILDPYSLGWDAYGDPDGDRVPDDVHFYRGGKLERGALASVASKLIQASAEGDLEVREGGPRQYGSKGYDIWEGYAVWHLHQGDRAVRGTLVDDRFDAFDELGRHGKGADVVEALIRPVLSTLGITLETIEVEEGEDGLPGHGPLRRDECLAMLRRVTDGISDPRGRRLVLIARAAVGDHAWRGRALASDEPPEREAGIVSLSLDTTLASRASAIVTEMIRGPTEDLRSYCVGAILGLEADHEFSDGRRGDLVSPGALDRLVRSLREAPYSDDWLPAATFLGSHGRKEGPAWLLEALLGAGPGASAKLWCGAHLFVRGGPEPGAPAAEKARWLEEHRSIDDFTWDGEMFVPRQ
jgi:hypothetical protein